jgi:acyl carrier protein
MSDTRTRLVKCFAAVFPELTVQQIQHASPESIPGWDSLASATLFTVLEEEFSVDIPPEDMDHLLSFQRTLDYLETRGAQAT